MTQKYNERALRIVEALLSGEQAPSAASPWVIGQSYLIRTVTMSWTGRLVSVGPQELVIEAAAWIPDVGRYHKATSAEDLEEVEPRDGPVIIGRAAVIDAVTWNSALPRDAK